jgi:hypothetical protein
MRLLVIASFFISLNVWACPELEGEYATCYSTTGRSAGSQDMVISQSVENSVTSYHLSFINNDTNHRYKLVFTANGLPNLISIKDPDFGVKFDFSFVTTCKNNTLKVKTKIKLQGESIAYSESIVSRIGNQIIIDTKGFDGEESYTEKEICE